MVDINGPTSCLIRGKELLANPHDQDDLDSGKSPVELEMEELQERYALIEALEARNEAQLESFVDERDQWESLEPEERELLQSKEILESRMEILTEQLVQLWMGQKSMEG